MDRQGSSAKSNFEPPIKRKFLNCEAKYLIKGGTMVVSTFDPESEAKPEVAEKGSSRHTNRYILPRPEADIKDECVILDDHNGESDMVERIETNDDEYVECTEEIHFDDMGLMESKPPVDPLQPNIRVNVNVGFGSQSSSSRAPFFASNASFHPFGDDNEPKVETVKDEPIVLNEDDWESDEGSGDNSDNRSSSANSSSNQKLPRNADPTKKLAHFKPAIRPRKYNLKPDEEKVNPKYQLKRARNNDAVRKARSKQKELKMQRETELSDLRKKVEELQDDLLAAQDTVHKQKKTIANQDKTIQKLMKNQKP